MGPETGIKTLSKMKEGVFLFFLQSPLFYPYPDFGLIAGSCATKNHEPRQVRKGATVMTLFVCHRVLGYHFFVKSLSFPGHQGL